MCIRIVDDEAADRIRAGLSDYDSIRFTDEYWYKFTKKNITKENAIRYICEYMDIRLEDIVAFGDDLADIGMLELCGRGVAMGNAHPDVKAVADIVIGTNDDDGIAQYLSEKIFTETVTVSYHEENAEKMD